MHEYQPTIIETRFLFERLLIQIAFLRDELKRGSVAFKKNPLEFTRQTTRHLSRRLRLFVSKPNVIPATLIAVAAITCAILEVVLFDRATTISRDVTANAENAEYEELTIVDVSKPPESMPTKGTINTKEAFCAFCGK